MAERGVCVVVGVGPRNGAAIARRFAAEGYRMALVSRSRELTDDLARELDGARAYACDVADAAQVSATAAAIRADLGGPEVLIYNAGSGTWGDVTEISAADFEAAWRVNAAGALAFSQAVIPAMRREGRGTIVFIGATASLRGGARSAAFAPAKAAQRSLAQSMARRLWPEGIHVALVVIDGVVDLPRTRARMPDKPDGFFLDPAAVAATVWGLVGQDRSAWSFEVEARPFGEPW